MSLFDICILLIVALSMHMVVQGVPSVKIVEGIEKYSTDTTAGTFTDSTSLPYVQPDPFTGPSSLYFLTNRCFMTSAERWEFFVCPFHNVTQRRVLGAKLNLLGVWGQWNHELTSLPRLVAPDASGDTASEAGSAAETGGSSMESSTTATVTTSTTTTGTGTGKVPKTFHFMQYDDGKNCAEDSNSMIKGENEGNPGNGEMLMTTVIELVCDYPGTDITIYDVDDSLFCKYTMKLGLPIACHLLSM